MHIIALYPSVHYRTGGQKRYLELLRGLAVRGNRVTLFHPEERVFTPDESGRLYKRPIKVGKGLSRQKAFRKGLKALIPEQTDMEKADLVLIFGESALMPAIWLKKKYGLRLITAVRNNKYVADKTARSFSLKNFMIDGRNRFREHQMICHSDKIIFQSVYDKDSYASRNRKVREKGMIIPNSIQASWFNESQKGINRSDKLTNILFIGSDSRRKGFSVLLDALEDLSGRDYDFQLTLVGDFPRTDEKSLPAWCRSLGRLGNPLDEMARADLMVCPSLYDSFPNTVLESLYAGTPVIGSDVAGIKAMLKHESLLFEPGNSASLRDTLEPLFHGETYQSVRRLCGERLEEFDFNWIDSWMEIINEE